MIGTDFIWSEKNASYPLRLLKCKGKTQKIRHIEYNLYPFYILNYATVKEDQQKNFRKGFGLALQCADAPKFYVRQRQCLKNEIRLGDVPMGKGLGCTHLN